MTTETKNMKPNPAIISEFKLAETIAEFIEEGSITFTRDIAPMIWGLIENVRAEVKDWDDFLASYRPNCPQEKSMPPLNRLIAAVRLKYWDEDAHKAATLLKVAPELLNALRNLADGVDTVYHSDLGWEELRLLVQKARAAIAKATS
ncbi:hypothetical protein LCGC14_2664650, partial [marine sediment metagenome]